MKYFFQSLSGTGLPIFSARGTIRNKSCFYKMETPPRIASCPRNPLIKFLSDYLGYSLSLLILAPSRTYFILPSRRRSKQRPMKTSVFVLPTHFNNFSSDIIDQKIPPMAIDVIIKMKEQRTKYSYKSTSGGWSYFLEKFRKMQNF